MSWVPWAVLVGAYLLGAIPFGLLLAHAFADVDVREAGSGNIGATNVARSAGKGLGLLTLFLDALKGAAPILVAQYVLELELRWVALAGLAAVLGHVFPIYLKFRGGKGVATALGLFVAIAPLPTGVAFGVFVVTYLLSKIVSLGSLLGALSLTVSSWFLDGRWEITALAATVTAIVLVRHTGNIRRMIERREHGI